MQSNKIDKIKLSFPVAFQAVENYENSDDRFTKVKIWLMHLGKNENGSIFEKKVVDKAMNTLAYIPIVGFIEKNSEGEDDFSDHRYVVIKDSNGVRRKYKGNAYGVIKSFDENNAHYEDRICDDGETRTFLVVDGIMWNMFEDSSKIINRDLIKSHSMELYDADDSVDGYEDNDGNFVFTKFSFRAACILGSDSKYQPAMTGSTVEVQFTVSDFIKDIQGELNDKYMAFTKLVNEKTEQGGKEDMSNTDFSQTALEQFSDMSNIVRDHETITDGWGDTVPRYYLVDIQDNEAIVIDRKDNHYDYYGFSFTMNGDKPEIDFTTGNRKKLRYENYEEGATTPDGAFSFGAHISEIENVAFAKIDDANKKVSQAETEKVTAETNYATIKGEYDEIKPKYEAYVKAEQERIDAENDAKKEEMFSQFEADLSDNTDFVALKAQKADFTVDEIEAKCSILYARKIKSMNYSKSHNSGTMTVGVMETETDKQDCNYVETKYGNIPVSR